MKHKIHSVEQAPEIITLYGLNVSPAEIRRAVRLRFERNRYVSDPKVIDILIHKGRADWQEVLNCWSQEPHILGILLAPQERQPRTFLEKFYEGTCSSSYKARKIVTLFIVYRQRRRPSFAGSIWHDKSMISSDCNLFLRLIDFSKPGMHSKSFASDTNRRSWEVA